jgi:hypothetical protein
METLEAPEATDFADQLNAYWDRIIREGSLSTIILHFHLKIEGMMEDALQQSLPNPDAFLKSGINGPGFSQKLTICNALEILDQKLIDAIGALNKLRNAYAHSTKQEVELKHLTNFLWAAHNHTPFTAIDNNGKVETFSMSAELHGHIEADPTNIGGMIFVSLRLIDGHFSGMFSDTPPANRQYEKPTNDE